MSLDHPALPETSLAWSSPEASADPQAETAELEARLVALADPSLQALARDERAQFEQARTENSATTHEAVAEFRGDLSALERIDGSLSSFPHFREFTHFLQSPGLSPIEREALFRFIDAQWPRGAKLFQSEGLPVNRESFLLFAGKFGIPTSTENSEKREAGNEQATEKLTRIAASLERIPSGLSPDLDIFRTQLAELSALDPGSAEFRRLREAIKNFLLGPDPHAMEGGRLPYILRELKEADAEAIRSGTPSRHYETFAGSMRDFSPDVARRIDFFEAHYDRPSSADGEPASSYQRGMIAAALPTDGRTHMQDADTFVSELPDGSSVAVALSGGQIRRSIDMQGVDYPLATPLEQADLNAALATLEAVRQNEGGKLARVRWALSFLENPEFANAPQADLERGLLRILGFELVNELSIRSLPDRDSLVRALQGKQESLQERLMEAEARFEHEKREAIQAAQARYEARDRESKKTLSALKHSGLGALGLDFLLRSIQGNLVVPDIGVPVDPQNFNPALGNFGEAGTYANTPRAHFEYIYRIANKILTGSPDGLEDGKLVGFSLEQAKRRPNVAQKTDAELKVLMQEAGVWHQDRGANRAEILKRLAAPLPLPRGSIDYP